jgi:hypothetical protein
MVGIPVVVTGPLSRTESEMSLVSTVIVVMPTLDDAVYPTVLGTDMREVSDTCSGGLFMPCGTDDDGPHHGDWGGTKAPQVSLAAGAFNYLGHADLLRWLAGLPWKYPAELQVLISGEHDDGFTTWTLVPPYTSWTPHRLTQVGNDFYRPGEELQVASRSGE